MQIRLTAVADEEELYEVIVVGSSSRRRCGHRENDRFTISKKPQILCIDNEMPTFTQPLHTRIHTYIYTQKITKLANTYKYIGEKTGQFSASREKKKCGFTGQEDTERDLFPPYGDGYGAHKSLFSSLVFYFSVRRVLPSRTLAARERGRAWDIRGSHALAEKRRVALGAFYWSGSALQYKVIFPWLNSFFFKEKFVQRSSPRWLSTTVR